ncbi:MAG: glycosyltransferase family 2 protein [Holosporales bacterium]|jgi:glycosyltransferase involved in cell wall biosynthesis|nr:glycosyltransferase family 2 protein [Holosporales bacterium]
MKDNPLVTIGIPTCRRPYLLARALESVAKQTYQSLEVYVADNATPGQDNEEIARTFKASIPRLIYKKHLQDIGQMSNHLYCLEQARGEFFMWLCDDDALSPLYIETAVATLFDHPETSFSALTFFDAVRTRKIPPRGYMENTGFRRALAFLTEDLGIGEKLWEEGWARRFNWLYGLHRTLPLHRSIKKVLDTYRFWWPNERWEAGLDDLILMDMLLTGKVAPVTNTEAHYIYFRNTEKHYVGPRGSSFLVNQINKLRYMYYRTNVHWIHVRQIYAQEGFFPSTLFAFLSIIHLMQDFFIALYEQIGTRFRKYRRS